MASPYQNYGADFFMVEYRVNGLWNGLFAELYAQKPLLQSFIICPEAYPRPELTSGLRADLLVSELVQQPGGGVGISFAKLVYEGKGSAGQTFDQIEEQLETWLAEAALYKNFDCWVVGTRGAFAKFWIWQKNSLIEIRWGNGMPENGPRTYDITQAQPWTSVRAMLVYMRNNPL